MPSACVVRGLGAYAPERVLTNKDLCAVVDTSDEWIVSRTGICRRRLLADGEGAADAGAIAAGQALEEANIDPKDITHLLFGGSVPDRLCPASACVVAAKLGIGRIPAYDFNAACSGFLYGLYQTRMILALEPEARILLVCAEALSRRINWQDRATCVLFGDGAGAVVVSAEEKGGFACIEDVMCTSDGALRELINIGGGGAVRYNLGDPVREEFFITMRGREIFKHAVRNMTQICEEILARNNCSVEDVQLFVPHQANLRIIEAVGERLKIPAERVFTNVADYGNTSSASIPLALYDARAQGRVAPGFRVLATGFGGGLTWGAALFRVL